MNYYLDFLHCLEEYFQSPNWKQLFLSGGCFWFASTLHRKIPNSDLMLNHMLEHCALYFDHGLYDVSGRISKKDFQAVTLRDISYMKKHYTPAFDTARLEQYLRTKKLL